MNFKIVAVNIKWCSFTSLGLPNLNLGSPHVFPKDQCSC
uniref:Uncharacterized protein n=1 Tax=Anguilla anguilla TaxID=7936 RepID=A0A0E9Q758_ANGAN